MKQTALLIQRIGIPDVTEWRCRFIQSAEIKGMRFREPTVRDVVIQGEGRGSEKERKTVREAEWVCHSAVRRSIKSVWLSALRRYGVIIRWQFYRKRSSRQIAPSILLLLLCPHVDSSSFRLILALSYMNSSFYEKDLECRHSLTSARSSNFNSSLMTINIFGSEFMWKVKASRNNGTIRSNLSKLAFYDIVHGLTEDHKCLSNKKDNRKCKQKEVVNYVK